MSSKTETIEIDSDTASVLRERAARRGLSVSQLVAELVPLTDEDDSIAELDRRWAAIESGEATVPHEEVERWLRTWGTPDFRPWSSR
jgi:predicted transcriptional regulator